MKSLAIAVALLCWSSCALAVDVYACKGKNGETVYTNVQCPDPKSTKRIGTYDKVPDDPRSQQQAAGQRATRTAAAPVTDMVVQSPPSSGMQADDSRPSNVHQCTGGGKNWIQSTPCPASVTTYTDVMGISGTDQYGNHITGDGTMVRQENVQQTDLSHDQACSRIKAEKLSGSAKDAYERNKMHAGEGC